MPPKARIDDDSFQQVLSTLKSDQLRRLDDSSTTDLIWGYLCVAMGKANNAENPRACYDAYRRKRVKFQTVVNQLIQENALQSIVCQSDPLPLPSPTNDRNEMVEISIPKPVAIASQVCQMLRVCLRSICRLFCRMSDVLHRNRMERRQSRFDF